MEVKKYRQRPVVVEAYRTETAVVVHTLEGDLTAQPSDYIITGVAGEQYPCKAEIFEATYEEVEE